MLSRRAPGWQAGPVQPATVPEPEQPAAKTALRRTVLAARARLSAAELDLRATALATVAATRPELVGAGTWTAYLSVGTEPGTEPLLADLRASGVRVLLPVLRPDRQLDWAVDEGPEWRRPAGHGLREPVSAPLGPASIATADYVLVPALAVDRTGNRLGRGGGYYDRALAAVPAATPVLAVVYDEEVLDAVPAEPHDRRVTGALTPSGVLPFR